MVRRGQRAMACVAVAAACGTAVAADVSIPQHVRQTGAFERIVVRTDKPLNLADLVGAADLVVEASAADAAAFLDKSEAHIYTDYPFTIATIFLNRRRPGLLRPGQQIAVRRETGTVMIEGHAATSIENGFPPFEAGKPYVLFLKQWPKENAYATVAGPLGAWVSGEQMVPLGPGLMHGNTPWTATRRDMFLGELRALLNFTNN
jgi:hypothetical protein